MQEIWKDVVGYEGYYQISNKGNLRSVTRIIDHGIQGKLRKVNGKTKKLMQNRLGYKMVRLYKNGKGENFKIHRLVATAFIPNPNNLPEVNHIDCNPSNNIVENLEWVSHRDNMIHAGKNGRLAVPESAKSKLGLKTKELFSIPIMGINLKTGETQYFESITAAGRAGFREGCISLCCQNKRKSHKGYNWVILPPADLAILKQEWGKSTPQGQ